MIVPFKMPARSCVDQVLKERYLFVISHLAFFVSYELVHQLYAPTSEFWLSPPKCIIAH